MSCYSRYLRDVQDMIGDGKKFSCESRLAEASGIKPSQVGRYLGKKKEEEKESNLEKFFKFLDTLDAQIVFPNKKLAEFTLVPKVKAIAGAGESVVTDDRIDALYAFRTEFLEKIHVKPKNAVLMDVSGDSMMPLIFDGDTLLFDTGDKEPRDGYIYVCSFGDALSVKRLQRIPHGWQLCSENPRYSPTPIQGDELELLRIHGRVRWYGHVLA